MAILKFLGLRRPTSLADQGNYREVRHDARPVKAVKPPKGVKGVPVGKGANRRAK